MIFEVFINLEHINLYLFLLTLNNYIATIIDY